MRNISAFFLGTLCLICASTFTFADIIVGTDGKLTDGKIVSATDKEIVIQPDAAPTTQPQHMDRAGTARVIYTDEHGGVIASPDAAAPATQPASHWNVPREPSAPPVVAANAPSYYLIPLHGEVGSTVLASALEKSFADAVLRKPTVVVLDIDSPGGSVAEAEKIVQIIHHYNKLLRIVALTNQDLSAAAIFSLSVKTIYVKPTSTIGAATSFIPGHPDLSAKVEEKMQSAWRAVARNSAEEGGHDPLLAMSMIDNSTSLHVETINGKPVVKEGDGDKMLVKTGQILTLTSHEAVDCGLAVDDAEDLASLGQEMGYANWTECKGLGVLLADYLPAQDEAFQKEVKKVVADFTTNLQAAATADPTQQYNYVAFQNGPMPQRPFNPRMPIGPNNQPPGAPRSGPPGQSGAPTQVVRTAQDIRHWKQRSLACVVALQLTEQNLRDVMAVCDAFGHGPAGESVNDTLTQIGTIRAKIYDDRNKYGPGDGTRPDIVAKEKNEVSGPAADAAADQLKKIEAAWQPATAKAVELLDDMLTPRIKKNDDGTVFISRLGKITTKDKFKAPVTFRIIALNNLADFRITYPAQIIFNWEMNKDQLKVDDKTKDGAGRLPANEWVGIEIVVKKDEMVIYVNGQERYRNKADYSAVDKPIALIGRGTTQIKSVSVIQEK